MNQITREGVARMKIDSCRSCGADIVWFKTGKINEKTGQEKMMPVNAETVEVGDDQLDLPRHVSHFSDCPHAKTWRKGS